MTFASLRREAARELAAAAGLLLLGTAGATAQTAPARVIDGDTLDVAGVRVRLWGIDAPESRQTCEADGRNYACGERATRHLRTLVAGRTVSCEPRTRDRYGRTVALCRTDRSDLGAAMVRDGWALAFVRYAADYAAEEREARAALRGMWQGAFTAPWEWRRMAARPAIGGGGPR